MPKNSRNRNRNNKPTTRPNPPAASSLKHTPPAAPNLKQYQANGGLDESTDDLLVGLSSADNSLSYLGDESTGDVTGKVESLDPKAKPLDSSGSEPEDIDAELTITAAKEEEVGDAPAPEEPITPPAAAATTLNEEVKVTTAPTDEPTDSSIKPDAAPVSEEPITPPAAAVTTSEKPEATTSSASESTDAAIKPAPVPEVEAIAAPVSEASVTAPASTSEKTEATPSFASEAPDLSIKPDVLASEFEIKEHVASVSDESITAPTAPATMSGTESADVSIEPAIASSISSITSTSEPVSEIPASSSSTSSAFDASSIPTSVPLIFSDDANLSGYASQRQLDEAATLAQANVLRVHLNNLLDDLYPDQFTPLGMRMAQVDSSHYAKLKIVEPLYRAGEEELKTISDVVQYREIYFAVMEKNAGNGRFGKFCTDNQKYLNALTAELIIQLKAQQKQLISEIHSPFEEVISIIADKTSAKDKEEQEIAEEEVVSFTSTLLNADVENIQITINDNQIDYTSLKNHLATIALRHVTNKVRQRKNNERTLSFLEDYIEGISLAQVAFRSSKIFTDFAATGLSEDESKAVKTLILSWLQDQQKNINEVIAIEIEKSKPVKDRFNQPDVVLQRQLIDRELELLTYENHLESLQQNLPNVDKLDELAGNIAADISPDERYEGIASALGRVKMMQPILAEKLREYMLDLPAIGNQREKNDTARPLYFACKEPVKNAEDIVKFCKVYKTALDGNESLEKGNPYAGRLGKILESGVPHYNALLNVIIELMTRFKTYNELLEVQAELFTQLITERVELKFETKMTPNRVNELEASQDLLATQYRSLMMLNGLTEYESEGQGNSLAATWKEEQSSLIAAEVKSGEEARLLNLIAAKMKSLFDLKLAALIYGEKFSRLENLKKMKSSDQPQLEKKTADQVYNTIILEIFVRFIPLIQEILLLGKMDTLKEALFKQMCEHAHGANELIFNVDDLIDTLWSYGNLKSSAEILVNLKALCDDIVISTSEVSSNIKLNDSAFPTDNTVYQLRERKKLADSLKKDLLNSLSALLTKLAENLDPQTLNKALLEEVEKHTEVLQLAPRPAVVSEVEAHAEVEVEVKSEAESASKAEVTAEAEVNAASTPTTNSSDPKVRLMKDMEVFLADHPGANEQIVAAMKAALQSFASQPNVSSNVETMSGVASSSGSADTVASSVEVAASSVSPKIEATDPGTTSTSSSSSSHKSSSGRSRHHRKSRRSSHAVKSAEITNEGSSEPKIEATHSSVTSTSSSSSSRKSSSSHRSKREGGSHHRSHKSSHASISAGMVNGGSSEAVEVHGEKDRHRGKSRTSTNPSLSSGRKFDRPVSEGALLRSATDGINASTTNSSASSTSSRSNSASPKGSTVTVSSTTSTASTSSTGWFSGLFRSDDASNRPAEKTAPDVSISSSDSDLVSGFMNMFRSGDTSNRPAEKTVSAENASSSSSSLLSGFKGMLKFMDSSPSTARAESSLTGAPEKSQPASPRKTG